VAVELQPRSLQRLNAMAVGHRIFDRLRSITNQIEQVGFGIEHPRRQALARQLDRRGFIRG